MVKKTRKLFLPEKYFKGLTRAARSRRVKEIRRGVGLHWKNPAAYRPFATDLDVPARAKKTSSYTEQWRKLFPNSTSLEQKAKSTGVPLKYIKESYNRGLAAWRTGHRPGATEQQWGYARAHSFLLCGKTHYTTDSDLVRDAKAASKSAKKWWKAQCAKKHWHP
jgi:hypothetical protein